MLTIENNSILILPNSIKNNVIKFLREKELLNIKFMSMEELIKKYYFSYENEAIYYLMNTYNYKYDIAITYLNNLYYLEDNNYNEEKLIFLEKIKKELDKNNLLIYDKLFLSSLKNRRIFIYGYNYLSKYQQKLISKIKEITEVRILAQDSPNYHHNTIYEFTNIEEEVTFVAEKIIENINNSIPINNIKICYQNKEYNHIIERIFKLYNIPIIVNKSHLYSTSIGKYFLDNLEPDPNNTLSKIEEKFNLTNENNQKIYNNLIEVLNNYTFCNNYLNIKDILIKDFKNKTTNSTKLKNSIEIINNLDNTSENDYIYLIGFNQQDIPKTYKDEDYLSDSIYIKLSLDTSQDKNKLSINSWISNINKTKNLIITYKLNDQTGPCYLSNLNDYLSLDITRPNITYKYSNQYNKLVLGKKLDNYLKYNEKDNILDLLYSNYNNINYGIYNNKFTGIDKNNLKKYLDNKLTISYSTINNYYHCSFRYYLSNILKLDIYKETFMTILGNLFHYILSICFKDEIDIESEYDNYLKTVDYQFSCKEKYFLSNLKSELIFIINTIKEQYEYNSLNNVYYEEKITVDKSTKDMEIIFKGFIDKLMLDDDKGVATIIDYKTGNPNLDLNNSIYGLDLQLPVYIYLAQKRFPNIRIVGFYLQKILNSKIKKDYKHSYLEIKKNNLKLQGYTNSDENLIKLLDSNYQESNVIKGMKTTSTGLGTKKILDDIKIDKLSKLVDKKIDEAIDNILDGNFDINPKRVGINNVGCLYCQFKDICFQKEDDIISLKEYKNLEFLEKED